MSIKSIECWFVLALSLEFVQRETANKVNMFLIWEFTFIPVEIQLEISGFLLILTKQFNLNIADFLIIENNKSLTFSNNEVPCYNQFWFLLQATALESVELQLRDITDNLLEISKIEVNFFPPDIFNHSTKGIRNKHLCWFFLFFLIFIYKMNDKQFSKRLSKHYFDMKSFWSLSNNNPFLSLGCSGAFRLAFLKIIFLP